MRVFAVVIGFVMAFSGAVARAEGEKAGEFDYYVMALSWSSNWCALEGDARGEDQCLPGKGLTFTLHGLWPQYELGWPDFCRTTARDPSRAQSAGMEDIMGSAGLAWYQWKKHGRCTGLAADAYFATSRKAFAKVKQPEIFAKISNTLEVPAAVVEEAFLAANPALTRDMITVTCRAGMIQEVRLCLTKDLEPRVCGADTVRDCTMQDAVLGAVR
ncbi:ribonuclease T2 [Pseudorhodobacter antarcticus]|jgi:ribonuclease T2|uniref:Ribonuclease T2 n=1 Tax=Pseudorhodobacter antarcticus TaxID=1077947 RepID=A0A1H8ADG3_9RHOB|nr:ribonuclease T2 [Pseudorhodobacter antarcticus]SEM67839.1 ribonuclease T2 [Pseudorhodobacter antarcticus]